MVLAFKFDLQATLHFVIFWNYLKNTAVESSKYKINLANMILLNLSQFYYFLQA